MAETFPNSTRIDVPTTGSVLGVAWSRDEDFIAVTSGSAHEVMTVTGEGKVLSHFQRQFNGPVFEDCVAAIKNMVVLPPQSPPPYREDKTLLSQTLSFWDAKSGTFLHNVEGPPASGFTNGFNWASHIALSPDGSMAAIATRGTFSPTYLFSTKDWNFIKFLAFRQPDGRVYGVRDLAFSSDGSTLIAAAGLGFIEVIDIHSGQLKRLINAYADSTMPMMPQSLAVSPDGKYAVIGSWNGVVGADHKTVLPDCVRVFDLQTGEKVASYDKAQPAIRKLAWNAAGDTIAIASNDNTVHLWKWRESKPAEILQLDDPVMSLAYSPDGKRLAVGNGNHLSIFNFDTSVPL